MRNNRAINLLNQMPYKRIFNLMKLNKKRNKLEDSYKNLVLLVHKRMLTVRKSLYLIVWRKKKMTF